jgi:sensor histidine kinase YesM
MDAILGILAGLFSGVATVIVARYSMRTTLKSKKLDVEAESYARADKMTADLLIRMREQINDLENGRKEDQSRISDVEHEVREVRNYNNQLITFIYKMIALVRRHELLAEIDPKDVPDGIHI